MRSISLTLPLLCLLALAALGRVAEAKAAPQPPKPQKVSVDHEPVAAAVPSPDETAAERVHSFREKVLRRAELQRKNALEESSALRQKVHGLEKKSDWEEFESDLWFIVKPLKFIFFVGVIGLLAVLGILAPLSRLFGNILIGVFRVADRVTRHFLAPVVVFFVERFMILLRYVKLVVEFLFNLIVEPSWRFVIAPVLRFAWRHRRINSGLGLVLGGALAVLWALSPPGISVVAFVREPHFIVFTELTRFVAARECIAHGPSTLAEMLQYPAAVVAFSGGCAFAHAEAVLAMAALVGGALAVFHGFAVIFLMLSFPGGAKVVLLPSRALLLLIASVLAFAGVALVAQSFARIVGIDIGVDMMYLDVFEVEPLEASIVEMEVAGAVEVTVGAALLSIGGRLAAVAVAWDLMAGHFDSQRLQSKNDPNPNFKLVNFVKLMETGLFWAALPLVRGMLAGRLGTSLLMAGIEGVRTVWRVDNSVHFGYFSLCVLGALALARMVSIVGPFFGLSPLRQALARVWRPLLAVEFLLCAHLFGHAGVAAAHDLLDAHNAYAVEGAHSFVPLVMDLLCSVGMLGLAGLTIGYPDIAWSFGDSVLSNMDLGLLSAIRIVYNIIVDALVVPLMRQLIVPVLAFVIGWMCLFAGHILTGVWLILYGVLSPFWEFIIAIYTNPLTALPASASLLWGLFQVHSGAIVLPWWLLPAAVGHWTINLMGQWISIALAAVADYVTTPLLAALVLGADHVASFLGLQIVWFPSIGALSEGSIFRDTQFTLRVYACLLVVGLVWRHVFKRQSRKFFAAFTELRVPKSKRVKSEWKALTTRRSIGRPLPTKKVRKSKAKKGKGKNSKRKSA